MKEELNKELMKLNELEILSLLKSNKIERELRKEIYALYIIKRTERLIIELLPLIANLGIAYAVMGMAQKTVDKIFKTKSLGG